MTTKSIGTAACMLALSLGCLFAPSEPLVAQVPQERGDSLLARVARAYEDFSYDSARTLALRLLQPEFRAAPAERAQAAFYMAGTFLNVNPPNAAEARRALARGIRASVFVRPDTQAFGSDLLLQYERARSSVFVIGIRNLPADTSLELESAGIVIEVGATRPATLTVTLESARRTTYTLATSMRVVGLARIPLSFRQGGDFLPTGAYTMKIEATDDSANARALATVPLNLVADSLTELRLPDSLAPAAFRPEKRPSGPAIRSLLGGLLVGGLTAAAGTALTPSSLRSLVGSDVRAFGVGGALAITGVIALIAGRPGAAIPAAMAYNEQLFADWTAERQRVLDENARRRAAARERLQVGEPSQ